ncbi:MAG: PIN domain-containing protein [Sedimenticolaceae bacterium]
MARRPEPLVFLDTHIVAWLYDGLVSKLSKAAEDAIEHSSVLAVSPMVRLELQYLHEIGRILAPPSEILADLRQSIGLRESDPRLTVIVDSALDIGWTRDTFDRLIVAEAMNSNADLVTKDARVRDNYERAIW